MPQDFTVNANEQQIDVDYLAGIKALAKTRGEVSPYETREVYATQKLVDAVTIPEINKVGQPMKVHVALADKFVEQGKATNEKPKEEKDSKAK
jgi:hypothetical protein